MSVFFIQTSTDSPPYREETKSLEMENPVQETFISNAAINKHESAEEQNVVAELGSTSTQKTNSLSSVQTLGNNSKADLNLNCSVVSKT
ncbi:unnamed protein product, partial [Gongylonema pulchrum]|uniref:Ovule protein n=1 Tax=Gongylonema pulchrum TaxID=637853 RepID=A0A183EZQ9_9BILA